jgi:uncharacterized protein
VSAPRPRRLRPSLAAPPAAAPPAAGAADAPFLLDFLPRQGEGETQLSRFYARLREGRLSTTRCRKDGTVPWPPRTVCPKCHTSDLEWIDLPEAGRLYAFSAVLGGAPLGMESDVPFAVGLVDLEGSPLRLFGRIVGRPWEELSVGDRVAVETYPTPDGRYFYRFRAADPSHAETSPSGPLA